MKLNKKLGFEVLLFVTFFIFIASIVLNKSIGDMDEIWNYNFANCIAKGLVPYKDFSMVQTPLLAFFAGGILNIFGNSLIVMRVLATVICSSTILLVYKVLDKLNVNKETCILSSLAMIFIYMNYFCIDYNYFSIFLTLLIIYFELKLDMNKRFNNILIGIMAGLVFLTKQTIGIFVCFSIVVYKLIFEVYKKRKKQEKIDVKCILYRILGEIIPILIFFIYLVLNNAVQDFIDYAILGVTTFSNKIEYLQLLNSNEIIIKILAIYVPINFVVMAINSIKNKDKNLFIILMLSLSSFVIAFPISDNIHFLIAIIPSIIGAVYMLNKLLKKMYNKKLLYVKMFLHAFSYLIIIYVLGFGILNEYTNIQKEKYYSQLNHYQYIPISEDFENQICNINDYIKESKKHVYIVNFDAAIYMIPLDIYNKNFDMLMKGNFGKQGDDGLIDNIKNSKDSIYLILGKEQGKNWQHPHKVTDYIQENLEYIGNINNYEIYQK